MKTKPKPTKQKRNLQAKIDVKLYDWIKNHLTKKGVSWTDWIQDKIKEEKLIETPRRRIDPTTPELRIPMNIDLDQLLK